MGRARNRLLVRPFGRSESRGFPSSSPSELKAFRRSPRIDSPLDGMMYSAPKLKYEYVGSWLSQLFTFVHRRSTKCQSPSTCNWGVTAYMAVRFPTMGGTPASSVPMSAPVGHPPLPGGQLAYTALSSVQLVIAESPLCGSWPDASNSNPYELTSGLAWMIQIGSPVPGSVTSP